MKCVFADTSYYIALVNPDDCAHDKAARWLLGQTGRVKTTEYVLLEVGNSLSKVIDKPAFARLIDRIGTDPATEVIPASLDLFDAGCRLHRKRLDKDWSLTDCISFVVMRREGLKEALTADKHFEQAGFTKLL